MIYFEKNLRFWTWKKELYSTDPMSDPCLKEFYSAVMYIWQNIFRLLKVLYGRSSFATCSKVCILSKLSKQVFLYIVSKTGCIIILYQYTVGFFVKSNSKFHPKSIRLFLSSTYWILDTGWRSSSWAAVTLMWLLSHHCSERAKTTLPRCHSRDVRSAW